MSTAVARVRKVQNPLAERRLTSMMRPGVQKQTTVADTAPAMLMTTLQGRGPGVVCEARAGSDMMAVIQPATPPETVTTLSATL